jgi:hypothetical protein
VENGEAIMEINMKEILEVTKRMEREFLPGQMETSIRVSSIRTCERVMAR